MGQSLKLVRVARRGGGFTFIELVIVMSIIAILAAVVVPRLTTASDDAEIVALQNNIRRLSETARVHTSTTGAFPAEIKPEWFRGGELPEHPQADPGVAVLEIVDDASLNHPASKVLTNSSTGAYWYNMANGIVRARVAAGQTNAKTLDAYNRANGCRLKSLSDG